MTSIEQGALLVGRYRVERLIGRGGTATVFRAYDRERRRHVALKQLRPDAARDAEGIRAFVREAQLAQLIRSEQVVRAFGAVWLAPNEPVLVFERLLGSDLAHVVKQRGSLCVAEAVAYTQQACDGLAAIHAAGITHGDIKPSNLFVAFSAGASCLKILDFGAAHLRTNQPAKAPGVMGSPPFMAPEQLRDEPYLGERRDLWALGAVLFTLLAGRSPFERRYLTETWQAILTGDVPNLSVLRADVPQALTAIVQRCLAPDPALRFGSANELSEALTPFTGPTLERLSA
ncbi:MAG TPA: serine/threonine-protein kinase [Polyangiales bacterium]|nr:serine/threonine-protein kinase [Polyangiales bacterium]